ncbi:hypothetical protein GOP47_0013366 [Adiantum capillus-veneris]|uniref:Protein arginine methyltransferase NDUFAF7 n=1 Tax=Adiantum capillus-veneris TaxID=13818 RepID=A0A9D4UND1_ADICA|nr:hypothetical protein GOP47_0013366 [Adiantum capillus-veneris]
MVVKYCIQSFRCTKRLSIYNRVSSFCTSPLNQTDDPAERHEEEVLISIDRSSLSTAPEHTHEKKAEESPMVKHIKSMIRFRGGPITLADYMEEVLTNPTAGFYMNRDVFGTEGDFITSPDVSQMFGELIGIWSLCLWQQMGQPKEVNVVELGPGRGTLMADFLRGVSKFKDFANAISVHLVECSPTLRTIQQKTLRVPMEEQHQSTTTNDNSPSQGNVCAFKRMTSTLFSSTISWHTDLEHVPCGVPTIIIGHEFFDALPIHQFQKSSRGWREKLVDVDESSELGLRFVLSPGPTAASTLYLAKRFKWAPLEEKESLNHAEVCPQALKVTHEIAKRVGQDGGGALIIDYGEDKIVSDSLQAIQKHKFVHVLHDPGKADLSAYVDFAALKHVVKESSVSAEVYGPITQSAFLGMLGINFRVEALLQRAKDDKQAELLKSGYWKLVGDCSAPWWEGEESLAPNGMGSRYKVLAVVNSGLGAPQCFQ